MKRRLKLFLTLLFISIGLVNAQVSKVTGNVISEEDGLPVVGASILVKGTTLGTITDIDGNFTLANIPSSAKTLEVSYIGMKSQQVAIKPNLKIVLQSDTEVLEEVVVTGMQKMDKRLFTGASTKISADDAKLDGVPEISRALEGRAAGVSVQNVSGTFGTAPKIRVRGATSIYGSSKPLWVVDGVIMEDVVEVGADDLSSGDAQTLISSAISGLNADDIESFQILKDGSATSIYGARAMAGVIVVTTKKGKAGSNKISYTGEFTMRMKPNYRNFNIMNSQEQMDVYKTMESNGYLNFSDVYRASNSGVYGKMYHLINDYNANTGTFGMPNTPEAKAKYLRAAEYRNTDWFDLLFNTNVSQNHAISMTSGTDKASYYTSLSMMNDPGWTKQSKVQRYTVNTNALYNISKQLSLNLIGNASYRKQRAPGTLSQALDPVSGEVKRDFDINPYSYALNTSRALDPNETYVRNYAPFNIFHELDNNYIDLDVIDLKFQGELKWKPIQKVEFSALGAYKYSTTTQTHKITDYSNQAWAYRAMDDATMRDANPWLYTDPDVINSLPVSVLPVGGFYNQIKYSMNSYDFRATASYNDVFNEKHIFNFFGGMELNATNRSKVDFTGAGMQYDMGMLPSYDYLYFKQGKEENSSYYSVTETHTRDVAFFATSTYSYNGKYTINGTVRYEGSNKLGKSRSARWLPTWNVSAAWNMHEESWFEKLRPTLSNLTLKASYSLTADRGPADVSNSRVIITSYNPYRPFASVSESGLQIQDLENSELTYEKKHELNIGAEIGFLDNRINLAVDWYKRNNYDLIGVINTMGVGGVTQKYANVASMKSHGIEFTLSTRNIVTKDFKWNTDFIFSNAKNEVTDLKSTARVIDLVSGNGFAMEGYPVRSLFSFDFRGLNEDGLPIIVDQNHNLVSSGSSLNFQERDIKDHLIYEGPTDPTITGSLGNVFTYKSWKLNVFITYSFGNVIRLDPVFSSSYSDLDAMPKEFVNRWTVAGDENRTTIPVIADKRLNQNDPYLNRIYNAYNYSTDRIAKGDFIRMKEISLEYSFPKTWAERMKLSNLSLKMQATNLFLIYADSKLNGQDPEFFNTGGVAAPVPKQFTLTLRLGI
ncbi:SusC/RagA family TonB-linked outer membrane protein [uncultured Bacteroides sp.]|uniref:SusC/RagA family TonB-linked outer membrane protein n=1 Tax=uncultured Bacteroides sp. TaxID=162156 RepID=UPI00262E09A4|nr:SusC/RagA family TonB-linked outer membrane protein [uncultured Bacteroides sp.]